MPVRHTCIELSIQPSAVKYRHICQARWLDVFWMRVERMRVQIMRVERMRVERMRGSGRENAGREDARRENAGREGASRMLSTLSTRIVTQIFPRQTHMCGEYYSCMHARMHAHPCIQNIHSTSPSDSAPPPPPLILSEGGLL